MAENIINSAMDEYSQKVYGPNGIAFNSPNKLQYDIDANAAAARVPSQIAEQTFPGMPGQVLGTISDLAMPALALGSSPFYDMYQAGDRARAEYGIFNDSDPNVLGVTGDSEIPMGPSFPEYAKAVAAENIPSSMMGRTLGAGKNLADRFGRITDGIGNLFFSPAGAAEINPNNTFTSSVANSPYEADYRPPNRYMGFEPRVGQDKFNIMNPAAEEKLSLFERGKELASSGIGKAGKLGMDAFNMLKNNNPLGFVSSLVNTRNALSPRSSNYNPNLQGQMDFLGGQTGTRITGTSDNLKFTDGLSMINDNKYGPGSVLSGQNVVSGFGTNDYGLQLDKYIEKMMSYATRSKFQQAKLDRAIAEKKAYEDKIASEAQARQSALDAAYASQSKASRDRQNAMTGGRYDGASSAQEYASDPGKGSTYSGSSKDGGVMGYGGKSGTPRYAQFKEGGKIDAKSFLDMIDVKASGSKSGKQQIQGAPKGITMDNESINAIVRADIPISEKIDILASYGYGKDRSKVEKDNEELFLGEGGYKDRNVGMGFNKDGEGIGGTMIYNIETGDPEFKIRFKKNFSKGGRVGFKKGGLATMFKLKG